MNKSLIAALLLVYGGALCAQGPANKNKALPEKKTAAVAAAAPAPQPAAQPGKVVKAEPAKTAPAKPADQDAEESVVMIDSKADADEDVYSKAYAADQEERVAPGGIPSSYGQCKGTINDGGRSLLVFESPDDGAVTFVQVTIGKNGVSWKLVDTILRSGD